MQARIESGLTQRAPLFEGRVGQQDRLIHRQADHEDYTHRGLARERRFQQPERRHHAADRQWQ